MLSALAWNYETLLAARVIAGLGIGAEFPVAFALLAEFSPKRLRHIIVSLGPIFFATGWFLCAAISTVVIPKYGWRAIYWVGVTPALLIIYVRQYLPESVRFLLQRGRIEEAGVIAKDLARRAGVTAELVPPPRLAAQKKPSLLEQFSAIRFAWVTIVVLGVFFFANWIQFMGFAAWLPSIFVRQGFTLTRSFNFTMIILAVTPFGQLFAMWLQERMSRKWAMLLLSAISTVSFIAVGLAFEMKFSIAVIVGAYVCYQFFSQGIIVILYTLGAELFPTSIRSIGMGLITAFARIGAILGPFILGVFLSLGTSIHEIIYYFASPLLIAAILAVIFIRVDPRQKTLEELA